MGGSPQPASDRNGRLWAAPLAVGGHVLIGCEPSRTDHGRRARLSTDRLIEQATWRSMRWIGSIGTMDDMTNPLTFHRSTPTAEHSAETPNVVPTRPLWVTRVGQVLTGSLALFLISSGAAKFGGGHVFQYIEHNSGIDLFHPFSNYVVAAAEVMAGAFILFRRTRLAGAFVASFVMVGAVAFHLSPWLGVSVPTGLTEGAAAPWNADDFVATTTVAPFVLAIVTCVWSLLVMRSAWRTSTDTSATVLRAKRAGRAAAV
jgi:uncharacterized membrane protein YphA (DoxX/SURF4 family)